MPLRVIFMGTPDFSVVVLQALVAQGYDIAAVYTRAPKPAGRGMAERLSPVHEAAKALGLNVRTPQNFRNVIDVAAFAALGADVGVVVAYGLLLPQVVLDGARLGCLNLHASLLPRWRGAAPIQRAIMAGDRQSGVMVMRMEAGLDTGPIGLAETVEIGADTSAGVLQDELAQLGADVMVRALAALARDSLAFQPQPATDITYAHKIQKSECRIDFARDAQDVHNHIRGLSPFPAAFFEADFGRGPERIKVLRAVLAPSPTQTGKVPGAVLDQAGLIACSKGAIRLLQVQRAGRAAMTIAEFARGIIWPDWIGQS